MSSSQPTVYHRPPSLEGYRLRRAHACGNCGAIVRAEYTLPRGVAHPSSKLQYWEWFENPTATGLVIRRRDHSTERNSYTNVGACPFRLLSFDDGARSAIDQLYAGVAGVANIDAIDIHIAFCDVDRLIATPLAAWAPEIEGRGAKLLMLAAPSVIRFYFAEGRMPTATDASALQRYAWNSSPVANQGFLQAIAAKVEPIRG